MEGILTTEILMEPFRTKVEEPKAEEAPAKEVPHIEGAEDKSLGEDPELTKESELDKWEIKNGKYGLEYLGIKEVGKSFPYNAQFAQVDKYIRETLEERGYDKTPQRYQEILSEIENEIGTQKLNALDRLKRLNDYIRVSKKYKEAKKKKESFLLGKML